MAFSEVNRLVSERIPLDRIISKYVKLEPTSKGFKGLCPFHSEKTPSFHVNTVENFFYCFGCGASGNAITFLIQKEGFSFSEAVIKLGEDFNIPELIKEAPEINGELEKERNEVFNANRKAVEFFAENLKENETAGNYLLARKVKEEMIEKFSIGFIGSGDKFIEKMKAQGIDMNTMMRAGLIRLDNYSKPSSFFYNRIMIPIVDRKNIIGFGGRIFSGDGPKYINSPDTVVFNKREHLFGIDFVRDGLKTFPFVVLCEGYFDVIAMHSNGFQTAVAALGTAVTEIHLETLAKFKKPVVIFLDGDEAGRKAAKRIATLKIPEDIDLRVAFIHSEGDDPDSLLSKEGGIQIVKNLIELSKPLFQELIDEQLESYNKTENLEDKLKIENKIRDLTKNIPYRKLRTYLLYIQKKSENTIKIYQSRDKKIEKMVETAGKKQLKGVSEKEHSMDLRIKKLVTIGALFPEFIPALEDIRDIFVFSGFGQIYEEMLKIYFDGESPSSIMQKVDESGELSTILDNKPVEFIEKSFQREHAAIKIELNTKLYEILCSDGSPEAKEKISQIILENNLLRKIVNDNEIKDRIENQEY